MTRLDQRLLTLADKRHDILRVGQVVTHRCSCAISEATLERPFVALELIRGRRSSPEKIRSRTAAKINRISSDNRAGHVDTKSGSFPRSGMRRSVGRPAASRDGRVANASPVRSTPDRHSVERDGRRTAIDRISEHAHPEKRLWRPSRVSS